MVLVIICDIITSHIYRCVSNGFRLGLRAKSRHCLSDVSLSLLRLVVLSVTRDEGCSRLRIVVVLRSSLMMGLPCELWFGLNLDLGLPLVCSGFSPCVATICDVPNCLSSHTNDITGYGVESSQSCAFLSFGKWSYGHVCWP